MPKKEKFVMFSITCNLGRDMSGKYFIQVDGNEDQISKFKTINTNGNVEFFKNLYTLDELRTLGKFSNDLLAPIGANDVEEVLILKGKLKVPGKTKIYSRDELYKWWEKYLGCPKSPKWNNIIEEVIDIDGFI